MWLDLSGDLRTAFRMLQRNPGTSSLIVATLALAIGAATIGFAFADLALFRGLPVDDNAKVVSIFASDTHGSTFRGRVSAPDLLDYRARTTTVEQLSGAARRPGGAHPQWPVTYADRQLTRPRTCSPRWVRRRSLAGSFERVRMSRAPLPVAVLSHHYWRDEMNSRADAIGKTLQIGRDIVTVVGVLKPDMEFGNLAEIDLWLPQPLNPDGPRDVRNLRFIGRLREGVTFDQAAAEMAAIGDALASEYPLTNAGWKIRLIPIRDITGGDGFWVVIVAVPVLHWIADRDRDRERLEPDHGAGRGARARAGGAHRDGREERPVAQAVPRRRLRPRGTRRAPVGAGGVDGTAIDRIDFRRAGLSANRDRRARARLRRDARADLPGGVFTGVGAADRASRSARSPRHAGRPWRRRRRCAAAARWSSRRSRWP